MGHRCSLLARICFRICQMRSTSWLWHTPSLRGEGESGPSIWATQGGLPQLMPRQFLAPELHGVCFPTPSHTKIKWARQGPKMYGPRGEGALAVSLCLQLHHLRLPELHLNLQRSGELPQLAAVCTQGRRSSICTSSCKASRTSPASSSDRAILQIGGGVTELFFKQYGTFVQAP